MNESTIKKAFYIFPGQQDCCPSRQRQVNRKSDSLTAAHPSVPTLKPPVPLVAVYLSRVYTPTHQTRTLYPTICGLKYIIIPSCAGKFKRRTKTHSAQSMALKCNRFSSFFAHAYSYICIIIIYVTRPVSIVCYKKHNPFFPQEFETEHWKEMIAKLLLSTTL